MAAQQQQKNAATAFAACYLSVAKQIKVCQHFVTLFCYIGYHTIKLLLKMNYWWTN